MKTMHLGPEELLVAAKIGVPRAAPAADVAEAIDAAERGDPRGGADRHGDLRRAGHLPRGLRPATPARAAGAAGH